ncbi:MAG: long-chain fatty acid--CoA ligase [Actinobacteria bacterium]|nr:long-chain fatty acid--CoA ligase [Actinomycetota bacterium]
MNQAEALDHSAFYFPDSEALVDGSRRWTYAEYRRDADRFAHALTALGVKRGDRVCLFMGNCAEFPIAFYGILKVGAIAVSISSMCKVGEVEFMVANCEAEVVLVGEACQGELPSRDALPLVRHVVVVPEAGAKGAMGDVTGDAAGDAAVEVAGDVAPTPAEAPAEAGADHEFWALVCGAPAEPFETVYTDREDGAEIIYTSGTTGKPKGVVLTHGNVVSNTSSTVTECDVRPDDRLICFLPLYHSFAQNFIFNSSVRAGATLVILPRFDMDEVLRVMAEERVTRWQAVPTIYILVLGTPEAEKAFASVRYCFSAASTMPVEVARQWFERFGLKINEGYGLTESTPSAVYNHTIRHKAGTVGTPIMNVEVQIWDPQGHPLPQGQAGEIVIKGPNVMKGYYNDPVATAETLVNGWLRTGDVGVLDEEGYLSIVDRIKDMVNSAGLKIWPREVEEVLYTHEAVAECAVIGVPDAVFGESVKACIVLRPGTTVDADDVIAYCKARLAGYKAPKMVEFMDGLPKSATGKILKTELRKREDAGS